LLWAWKVKLERLKGEVERALHCVYEGLDLFGLGKDWVSEKLKPKPKTQPKTKFKSKTKKGVKLRTFRLLRKPKPNSVTDLGTVRKPKTHSSKVGSSLGLDEGCEAPSVLNRINASPEVVLLPASEAEADRQGWVWYGMPKRSRRFLYAPS
jgi:hypothetical protein